MIFDDTTRNDVFESSNGEVKHTEFVSMRDLAVQESFIP